MQINGTEIVSIGAQAHDTKPAGDEALREACQEFAAVFWQQVLSQMRRSVPSGGLFNESAGEEAFKSMLDTEYARTIARSEGSLAEILFRQLANKDHILPQD